VCRRTRRDLFDLADKLGLDLGASSKAALEELTGKALVAEDEALVADFVRRKTGKSAGNDDAHPARDNLAESLTMKGCSRDET
jgi:hypothetical protein